VDLGSNRVRPRGQPSKCRRAASRGRGRIRLAALALAVAVLGLAATAGGFAAPPKNAPAKAEIYKWHQKNHYRASSALRWFRQTGVLYRGSLERRARLFQRVKALRWLRSYSAHKIAEYRASLRPPHYEQWLCIHRYEGAWNDPGAPYYGGLQMDLSFQRAYGWDLLQRKGTADNWTPLEQMRVAERAWRSRGFGPWPNTARYCGLIG